MKISIGKKKPLLFVHPVFVIGTYNEDNVPNIMTVSWGGVCCGYPPCVAISLRKATYTYNNLMKTKAFTLNIPSEKLLPEADYAGTYSGRDQNKFEALGLTSVHSEIVNAPYIKEFPMSLLCNVIHIYEIGLHTQFIGEIHDIICEDIYLNDKGLPDLKKINPVIYNSAEKNYFGVGNLLINAYSQEKK